MNKELRDSLVTSLVPVNRLASPGIQFIRFFGVSLVFVFIVAILVTPRSNDLGEFLTESYLIQLLFILCGVATSGVLALRGAKPGYPFELKHKVLAVGSLLLWPIYVSFFTSPHIVHTDPGVVCTGWIIIASLALGLLLVGMLKRGAVTSERWTGLMALSTAAFLGALLLHIICPSSEFDHLFYWHVVPAITIPLAFVGVARRFFRE